MDITPIWPRLYPYYFYNGVRSEATEKAGTMVRELSRELNQGTCGRHQSTDQAYISFKKQ